MRYFTEKPDHYETQHGFRYICNHPVYTRCTLFLIDGKGLAVIQQRYRTKDKSTWWDEIDPWLNDLIYNHPKFKSVFDERAGYSVNAIYPTITVRQLMWLLRMKPLRHERWETYFDRKDI